MKCSYAFCEDYIKIAQKCPKCKLISYCSTNCRTNDWYKNHRNVCGVKLVVLEPEQDKKLLFKITDQYEDLNTILGSGAYGEVKLVREKSTSKLYAMKVINKKSLEQEAGLEVIMREITVHKELNHPNIIKLYDNFEDAEMIYLMLEYAESGSLFQEIHNNKKLTDTVARSYFFETLSGIMYLHDNNIVHRDIKPENILIDKTGTVKICDFGWCVKGDEPRSTFCGTLDYMAPEMIRNQKHSYEVDIWALGVLLYEMLHGYSPFDAAKEADKCHNIVTCKYAFESSVNEMAKDLIKKMIQSNPSKRIKLKDALAHPFFNVTVPASIVQVGNTFRAYAANYGMDEGVVQDIKGSDCTVLFKKSGIKEIMTLEEVERRIKRGKLGNKKDNSVEDESKETHNKELPEKKIGKVAELAKRYENTSKSPDNYSEKPFIFNPAPKSIKIPDFEKNQSSERSSEETFKNSSNQISTEKVSVPRKSVLKSQSPKDKQNSRGSASSNEKKVKFLIYSSKNSEKNSIVPEEDKVQLLEEAKVQENLEKSEELEKKKSKKSKKIKKNQEDSLEDFEKGKGLEKNDYKVAEKPIYKEQEDLEELKKIENQENSEEEPIIPQKIPEINPKISRKEENIYSNLDAWIKAPTRKKTKNQRPKPEKLPESSSESPVKNKLDKNIEKFKKKFSNNPIENPSIFYIKKDDPDSIEIDERLPHFKSGSANASPDVSISYYEKKKQENSKKMNQESINSSIDYGNPGVLEIESKYKNSKIKDSLLSPMEVFSFADDIDAVSPNFTEEHKDNTIEERSEESLDDLSNDARNIFDEKEKASLLSNMKKSGSSSSNLNYKDFYDKGADSPRRDLYMDFNKINEIDKKNPPLDFKDFDPEPKVKKNLSSKDHKKISNYEAQRELLEQQHEDYYSKIEEVWIDRHDDLIEAPEMSENEVENISSKNFQQYDKILLNPPSVVSNADEYDKALYLEHQMLAKRKKELEDMIKKVEGEKKYSIKIKREKKSKDGFLHWIGGIIGCSDRY